MIQNHYGYEQVRLDEWQSGMFLYIILMEGLPNRTISFTLQITEIFHPGTGSSMYCLCGCKLLPKVIVYIVN